jgi:hypothetical protein
LNERMGSIDSETGRAQKARTSSRGEIATRVTKSGASVDADRGSRVERELAEGAVEVEGETAMDL